MMVMTTISLVKYGPHPRYCTVYEQVQSEKLKSKLQGQQRTEGAAQQSVQQAATGDTTRQPQAHQQRLSHCHP